MGTHTAYTNKKPQEDNLAIVWITRGIKFAVVAAIGYTALSYLPAFMPTAKFANITNHDRSATRLNQNTKTSTIKKAYFKVANLRQAYLRAGQSVQVQYYLPENAHLELVITHCKRSLILEAFSCIPYKTDNLTVAENTIGTREFVVDKAGFYKFSHTVIKKSADSAYQKVFWRRSS